jgi:hypothetical protein
MLRTGVTAGLEAAPGDVLLATERLNTLPDGDDSCSRGIGTDLLHKIREGLQPMNIQIILLPLYMQKDVNMIVL